MKKLPLPAYDDNEIATNLSENTRLKYAYPLLQDHLETVLANYEIYMQNSGNPWEVAANGGLPEGLNEALKGLYITEPAGLSVLSEIRKNISPRVCPMCGGFGNGTLDHYLPQKKYPQYSILTKNLVPACNCNSLRKEKVKGINGGERALHPYFDDCLQVRALSVVFAGDFDAPSVTIDNCYPTGAVNYDAVAYHIEEIVKSTNIKDWMIKMWADLLRVPRSVLDTLPNTGAITEVDLVTCINSKMTAKDQEFETPNNWDSAFFHGLIHSHELSTWLIDNIDWQ